MPDYGLNLSAAEVERAISGAHFFLVDSWGYTGKVNLQGDAYLNSANILNLGVENDLSVTGDSTVYGDLISFNNGNIANLNVTGNSFINNFTGQTNFNRVLATGSYSEISQIRGGLKISGNLNVNGNVSNTGLNYTFGNNFLLGNFYQTGENHLLGDSYQTGTARISGELYVNGIQITGGAVGGGGGSVNLTGDLFSAFTQKGQLIVGSGNGTGSFLGTGSNQSGYALVIDPSKPLGLEWREQQNSELQFFSENYGAYSTPTGFFPPNGFASVFSLTSASANANTSIVMTPKGEGGFKLGSTGQQSLLGDRAVDLQMFSDSGHATAMGDYSTIGGGLGNLVHSLGAFAVGGYNRIHSNSNYSFAGGRLNEISNSQESVALGSNNEIYESPKGISIGHENLNNAESYNLTLGHSARASRYGEIAIAGGSFAAIGDSQKSILQVKRITSNNTQSELFLDGSSKRAIIKTNSTCTFSIEIVGRRISNTESAAYLITGLIKNDAGTVSLVSSINKTVLGEDDATWDATAEADNTNKSLAIKVTGATDKTIRWGATVELREVLG